MEADFLQQFRRRHEELECHHLLLFVLEHLIESCRADVRHLLDFIHLTVTLIFAGLMLFS